MTLAAAQVILNAQAPTEKVRVFKDGNDVYIRSCFSPTQDVVIVMNKGLNDQINFSYTTLIPSSTPDNEMLSKPPVVIHICGDDSTPWVINDTYLGLASMIVEMETRIASLGNFSGNCLSAHRADGGFVFPANSQCIPKY